MGLRYRYLLNEEPLRRCPGCGYDLESFGGVQIVLCVARQILEVPSRLWDGHLADTEDNAVANGFHVGTCCGGCDETLIEFDDVREVQLRKRHDN